MTIDKTNHMRRPKTSISFSNVEEFLLFDWATEKNKVKKDTIFDQNYDIFKPFLRTGTWIQISHTNPESRRIGVNPIGRYEFGSVFQILIRIQTIKKRCTGND